MLESSSVEKLTMSQQCPCGQDGQGYPGTYQEDCDKQIKGYDLSPLFSPSEMASQMLCPVLGFSMQDREGATGGGPAECGASLL